MNNNFVLNNSLRTIPLDSLETNHSRPNTLPQDVINHFNLGNEALHQGLLMQSIEHYKKASQFLPLSAEIQNNLGVAYVRMGCFLEAIEYFRRATKINQSDIGLSINLGKAFIEAGKFEEGINFFLELIMVKDSEQVTNGMMNLLKQLNSMHKYLQSVMKLEQNGAILFLYEAIDNRRQIIVGEEYDNVMSKEILKTIALTIMNILCEYYTQCDRQHQYCHAYHTCEKHMKKHMKDIQSPKIIKIICLLLAFIFAQQEKFHLSWYYFQKIDELQQNSVKNIFLQQNQRLMQLKEANPAQAQIILAMLYHTQIHQSRINFIEQKQQYENIHQAQLNNSYAQQSQKFPCLEYIVLHSQTHFDDQFIFQCVMKIPQAVWLKFYSSNDLIFSLQSFLDKPSCFKDRLFNKIGSIHLQNKQYYKALSYFRKSIIFNPKTIKMMIPLFEQCYQGIGEKQILHEHFFWQFIEDLIYFQSAKEDKNFSLQSFKVNFIIYLILNKQYEISYQVFQASIEQISKESIQTMYSLFVLKILLFSTPQQMSLFQTNFYMYIYGVLLYNGQIDKKFTTYLRYMFLKNYQAFEKCQQQFSQEHKIVIYKMLISQCDLSIDTFFVLKIQQLIRSLPVSDQVIKMIGQIKEIRFRILQKQNWTLRRKYDDWLELNTKLGNLDVKIFAKRLRVMLDEFNEIERRLSYSETFLRLCRKIQQLVTHIQFSFNRNKELDVKILKQSGTELFEKLVKMKELENIYNQFIKDQTNYQSKLQNNQIIVNPISQNNYISKALISIFYKYFMQADKVRFWKRIRQLIVQDNIPQNSSFYLGSFPSVTSQTSSMADNDKDQSLNHLSVRQKHCRIMHRYLQKNYASVAFGDIQDGWHYQKESSLTYDNKCKVIQFVVRFIIQLQKLDIFLLGLKLEQLAQLNDIFYLPPDTLFFKLTPGNKKQDRRPFESTLNILTYLSSQQQQCLRSIKEKYKCQINQQQLQCIMKEHHFYLISTIVSSVWHKSCHLQGQIRNKQKHLSFLIEQLLSKRTKYYIFLTKLTKIAEKKAYEKGHKKLSIIYQAIENSQGPSALQEMQITLL